MGTNFGKTLKGFFSPISLTQLNATASFMDRIETKFLMTEQEFIALLPQFKKDFYVLEIGGKSIFEYDNVYMDTEDYEFYIRHQEGKKKRTKVRTREYVDSGYAFFEYKQKQDKLLRKFRYPIALRDHGKMTSESKKFYEGISMSFSGREKLEKIFPSLRTEYNRLTLCSKDSAERVTIDFDIKLSNLRGKKSSNKLLNAVIIESKTTSENCESHKILKNHNIEKASSCSKYCLGLLYSGVFSEKGRFKKTMKKFSSMS